MPASSLDQVVSLCKRRGFVFPGSEIYGGLANTWDYGPLGVEVKNRVKREWWKTFVHRRSDIVGYDAAILMHPKTWEASGHVAGFADPLVSCKKCGQRFRGDKLLEEELGVAAAAIVKIEQVQSMLIAEKVNCPNCGNRDWTESERFNLMFKTHQGVLEDKGTLVYLRPETAQGIFVNFKNVLQTSRMRLPFGIAQIGKAFRNEITPGNFTFRTREFEQMEIEYFVDPTVNSALRPEQAFDQWKETVWDWYEGLGIAQDRLRVREHAQDELSHYSSRTLDIEYQFPWGWGELFGLANRGDFDLTQHEKFSGEDLKYTDPEDATIKFLPHVIEPSFGCDRTVLTLLLEAYAEEKVNGEKRTVMKFDKRIAPVDLAILPLSKKENLINKAQELYKKIVQETDLVVDFDVTGSIGKRYRRQDEIGTALAVTVDFGTIGEDAAQGEKDTVTIRDRDTLKQERVAIGSIREKIAEMWRRSSP